jgi:hypothetical protein
MTTADVVWCFRLFHSLAEGGTWAVPRSGLIFQRQGDKLVLIQMMPHDPAMPMSADELRAYQQDDYDAIASRFRAGGIPVEKEIVNSA